MTAENVIHGRVLSTRGLRARLQHRKVNARDREHRMPSLLVRLNIISRRQTAIQKIPLVSGQKVDHADVLQQSREILDATPIGAGDLLIIHSVSGRNGVPVEMALEARRRGVYTAAITNLTTSRASASRHPSGQRLFEVCDLVIDNCGCIGDAAIDIEGFRGKTAATSTVTGAAIVNAFCAEVVGLYVANGLEPPVFMSANVDGGDKYNEKMMERYKDKITYQG